MVTPRQNPHRLSPTHDEDLPAEQTQQPQAKQLKPLPKFHHPPQQTQQHQQPQQLQQLKHSQQFLQQPKRPRRRSKWLRFVLLFLTSATCLLFAFVLWSIFARPHNGAASSQKSTQPIPQGILQQEAPRTATGSNNTSYARCSRRYYVPPRTSTRCLQCTEQIVQF